MLDKKNFIIFFKYTFLYIDTDRNAEVNITNNYYVFYCPRELINVFLFI